MEISSEYLADLLIGIAKAQTAVIDAMERANPGFRNTHAVPLLQIAANMRAGDPRLIDLPARVLLRMQGRVALENASVVADLERLAKGGPPVASDYISRNRAAHCSFRTCTCTCTCAERRACGRRKRNRCQRKALST